MPRRIKKRPTTSGIVKKRPQTARRKRRRSRRPRATRGRRVPARAPLAYTLNSMAAPEVIDRVLGGEFQRVVEIDNPDTGIPTHVTLSRSSIDLFGTRVDTILFSGSESDVTHVHNQFLLGRL
jgi:hypothetical protein